MFEWHSKFSLLDCIEEIRLFLIHCASHRPVFRLRSSNFSICLKLFETNRLNLLLQVLVNYARSSKEAEEVSKEVCLGNQDFPYLVLAVL